MIGIRRTNEGPIEHDCGTHGVPGWGVARWIKRGENEDWGYRWGYKLGLHFGKTGVTEVG